MSRTQVESLTLARQKIASLISIYMPMAGHAAAVATFNAGVEEFEAAVREDERDIILKPVAPVVDMPPLAPPTEPVVDASPADVPPTVSPSEPVETTHIDSTPPPSDTPPATTGKSKGKNKSK